MCPIHLVFFQLLPEGLDSLIRFYLVSCIVYAGYSENASLVRVDEHERVARLKIAKSNTEQKWQGREILSQVVFFFLLLMY